MSSLIVEVTPVLAKRAHSNADRLEMVQVKGWWVAVQKDLVEVGQPVVYLPPDSIVTEEYADQLGIAKYLSPLRKNLDGSRPPGLRVRAARFRGEASYGTIDHEVDPTWSIGQDVADVLAVRKWEPPRVCLDGDAAPQVPVFHKYTDIENLRNFPLAFGEGELVVVTEKLHGKNGRWGLIVHPDEDGVAAPTFMAGSHDVRRKPVDLKGRPSDFWEPLKDQRLRDLLGDLSGSYAVGGVPANVIVFGELINTQKGFPYGHRPGELGFRVFDISVNLNYLDHDRVVDACGRHDVPMVPALYEGPFSWEKVEEHVNGPTSLSSESETSGSFGGREGIVVKPLREAFSRDLPGDGRKIAKVISVDYLELKTKKGGEDVDSSDA